MLQPDSGSGPLIDVRDLVFRYDEKRALDRVSCAIDKGSVTALVGPNGAGKTTLIRCIVGLYEPLDGSVLFEGHDVFRNSHAAHRRMGYLTDFFGVYDALTVRRCLIFAARAHGVADSEVARSVACAAERLSIASHMGILAKDLSRGLRQRLAIAQTIIHDPAFMVLDEPASGLDPEARKELSHLLLALRDSGMTILVSSHILAELEDYCTAMLVLRDGRIVEQTSLYGKNRSGSRRFRVELASEYDGLSAKLDDVEGVSNVAVDQLTATFEFAGDARAQQQLLQRLVEGNVPVRGFGEHAVQLQDAYFAAMHQDRMTGI